jgi:hypothetical protein
MALTWRRQRSGDKVFTKNQMVTIMENATYGKLGIVISMWLCTFPPRKRGHMSKVSGRFLAIIAGISAIGVFFLVVYSLRDASPQSVVGSSSDAVALSGVVSAPVAHVSVALTTSEPGIFQGFSTWNTEQRLMAINAIMSSRELDLDVLAFLQEKLGDKKLAEGIRNNIANALIFQDRHDGQLAGRLLRMVDDTGESMTWRDYALQHASRAVLFSDQPQAVFDRLLALMEKGEGTLPGTAILQLNTLDHDGVLRDAGKRIDLGILAMVADERADVGNRMSAISAMGMRGMVDHVHLVRDLVRTTNDGSLQRVALATLGYIGSASDVALIQRYVDDANTLVALAARGALTRVQEKANTKLPL